jgi:hypothetical protein
MSFYYNTRAIGKALARLNSQGVNLFGQSSQLNITNDRCIMIDADDENSKLKLNKEGICFTYNKNIKLPTGDIATASVCRPLKGAAYTKEEIFKYDNESENPNKKIDKKHVIVTARALTDLFSHGKDTNKEYIRQISNTLNPQSDDPEIKDENILPTVRAIKAELGLTYEDVSKVVFTSIMADSVLTLNWKLNQSDLFNSIEFTLYDKSTLKTVTTAVLNNSSLVQVITINSTYPSVLIGVLKKNTTVVGKISKIFN